MEIREYVNSEYAKGLDTEGLRSNFLIRDIFAPDRITMTYSHVDRMIAGGITPKDETLALAATKELGTSYFLERREMGIINIGGPGTISVDGARHAVGPRDGFYISMGSREVAFSCENPDNPAKYYFNSAPAHRACPTRLVTLAQAKHVEMGSAADCNKRVINQYIHPAVLETANSSMGMTVFSKAAYGTRCPPIPMNGAWKSISISTCRRPPRFPPHGQAGGDQTYRRGATRKR